MLGKYLPITIWALTTLAAQAEALDCSYFKKGATLTRASHCATRQTDGQIQLSAAQRKRLTYSGAEKLAALLIDSQWYYVKSDGRTLAILTHDNGPDTFSEGLVRAQIEGKIAFFDAEFQQVIPPVYDWAWPFKNGEALVCIECKQGKPDADGHIPIIGGNWGYIDQYGYEVAPLASQEEFKGTLGRRFLP